MLLLPDGRVMAQVGSHPDSPSNTWDILTPDAGGNYVGGTWSTIASMATGREAYASNLLPNGDVFVLGGEYSTAGVFTNLGEIYNPTSNQWAAISQFPQPVFGDDPTVVLPPDSAHPQGQILAGYIATAQTYSYDLATGIWSATGTALPSGDDVPAGFLGKIHPYTDASIGYGIRAGDKSDEESFTILPDGSAVSYDIFASDPNNNPSGPVFLAQRYFPPGETLADSTPSTGLWEDASHISGTMYALSTSTSPTNDELGPAVYLPTTGQIFVMGANGETALYDPSGHTLNGDGTYSYGTWTHNSLFHLPSVSGVQLVADDDPAAVLPNGNLLVALHGPSDSTDLYEFDPSSGTPWTPLNSSFPDPSLLDSPVHFTRMLNLPNGDVLLSFTGSTQVYDFSDSSGSISSGWVPTISSVTRNGDGNTFTLDETGLTGVSEGATYGDDAEMSSNYPIVKLTSNTNSNIVFYAPTYNWTPGIDEGSSSVQFALPLNLPPDSNGYSVRVVANGIASNAYSGSIGAFPGPIYVDTNFSSSHPNISDADPVAPGLQPATFGTNAFNSVNAAISQAATEIAAGENTWVIVNGDDGSGSGNFAENVADNAPVLLVLQEGEVQFTSLAGNNAAAKIDLNGVPLYTDGDSSADPFDGAITGSGTFNKRGSNTLPLNGTDDAGGTFVTDSGSGTSTLLVNGSITGPGGLTVNGGKAKVGAPGALAGTTVNINVSGGLDVSLVSTATLGALNGSGNIALGSTNLTIGGVNTDASYSGNLSDSPLSPGSITKVGTDTWFLSGDNSGYFGGVTISTGTLEMDSANALFSSTVTVNTSPGAGGLTAGSGIASFTLGGLAGGGDVQMGISTTFTIGGDDASTTFSGALYEGGSLVKAGTGTLTLSGVSSDVGDTTVSSGVLALGNGLGDVSLPGGAVTVATGATLEFTQDDGPFGPAYMGYSVNLDGGTMSVDAGKVVEITAPVTGTSTTTHGFLSGSGTFETYPDPLSTSGVVFTHLTSTSSVTIDMVQSHDSFVDFNDGGTLNVAPGLDADSGGVTTITFNGFTIDSTGSVEIMADPAYIGTHVNASNFQSSGTLTIDPAEVGSGYHTLLTDVSPPATPAEEMEFESGSHTYIGTVATVTTGSPPTQSFVAGIDLDGHNAHVHSGLFQNDGFVADSSDGGAGPGAVIDDGPSPTLVDGYGFYQNSVQTINGGSFKAGHCPGVVAFGHLTFGPDGITSDRFYVNDATGAAGPSPDANGQVSGWSLFIVDGNFTWAADADGKLTVNIETLANPTTVGIDVAGSMDHFDPSQSDVWEAVHWTGTYTGPTDSATLNAATTFDTSAVVNAFGGKFSWVMDAAAKTLSLVYTPPPAVAAVDLSGNSITVTFSTAVNFAGGDAAGAFRLTNTDTGANVDLTATVSTDAQGRTVVTLSFSGGDLAAGHYRLSVLANAVTGNDGTALDGTGLGSGNGTDYIGPDWTVG